MTKKAIVILTLCLFVCLTTLAAAETKMPKPANKDAAKKMEKAEKLIKDKELDKAQTLLQEVIQLEPNYAPAYYFSGAVHRLKKENDPALAMLAKAIELQPDFPQAVNEYTYLLNSIAHELGAQNQPEKAMPYYARIIAVPGLDKTQKPLLIEACFNLGISAFQAQKFAESAEAFDKLLAVPGIDTESKQRYVLAQYMLGVNQNIIGKIEESTAHLLKYLELTSAETATQFTAIASYLVGKNEYSLLDQEVTKLKNDKTVTDMRAKVQALAKARVKIPEMVQKALAIKADIEDAYVLLGNFYYLGQDLDQAIATYKTLIEKFPASQSLADYRTFVEKLDKEKNPPPPPPPPAKGKKK